MEDTIKKELSDMDKQQVWEIMKKEDIPENRRSIKCKWMFKIKRNGIFRARLVACGYSQIPGIDFNECIAPVINDITFQIMLILMVIWILEASIVYVKTAFLQNEVQEEVCMNVPEGMSHDSRNCLLLTKISHGLVQSVREFYKKLMSTLKLIGFMVNKSYPCLLSKLIQYGFIMIGIYVDDYLVGVKRDRIAEWIGELKKTD
jgi:hypothetical protein